MVAPPTSTTTTSPRHAPVGEQLDPGAARRRGWPPATIAANAGPCERSLPPMTWRRNTSRIAARADSGRARRSAGATLSASDVPASGRRRAARRPRRAASTLPATTTGRADARLREPGARCAAAPRRCRRRCRRRAARRRAAACAQVAEVGAGHRPARRRARPCRRSTAPTRRPASAVTSSLVADDREPQPAAGARAGQHLVDRSTPAPPRAARSRRRSRRGRRCRSWCGGSAVASSSPVAVVDQAALVNVEPKSTQRTRRHASGEPVERLVAGRRAGRRRPRCRPRAGPGRPGTSSSVPATERVRHPAGVLDQRLDAAERLAEGEDLGRGRRPSTRLLLAAGDPEDDHAAEALHLPRGDLVAGVLRQARGRCTCATAGWPVRNSTTFSALSQCRSIRTRERLEAAQHQPGVERPGDRAHRVLVEGDPLSAQPSRSRDARRAPPTTSEWPPQYFVVECTTTSAPSASGCWRYGEAKVLSTTSSAPASWATLGERRDVGDAEQRVGRRLDPDHLGLRPGRIAARTASTSATGGEGVLEAPGPRDLVEEPVGAAVRVVGDDDVVAGRAAARAAGCPRRPGRRRTRSPRLAALERGEALLERGAGRVGASGCTRSRRAGRRRRPACRSTPGRSAGSPPRWWGRAPGRRGSPAWRSRPARPARSAARSCAQG